MHARSASTGSHRIDDRDLDRNWELMAAFEGTKVTVPALYVAGDQDMGRRFSRSGRAYRQYETIRASASGHPDAARL